MNWDRTVHATRADGTQIARYDRGGKWYAEPVEGRRRQLTLAEAAAEAGTARAEPGGKYPGNTYGGTRLDAAVRKLEAAAKGGES